MKIISSPKEMKEFSASMKAEGKKIALVPTMGALHNGHLSLIDIARQNADIVVVSIFVNPTQFGPNEDYDKYPRQLQADAEKCEEHNADVIFAPTPDERGGGVVHAGCFCRILFVFRLHLVREGPRPDQPAVLSARRRWDDYARSYTNSFRK